MESTVGSVSDVAGSTSSRNELAGSTTECLAPPSPTNSGCSVWSFLCFCRNFRWNKSGSRTSLLKNGLPSSVCASKATLTSDCAAAAADPDHQPCCNRNLSSAHACHKHGPCCAAAAAGYSTYTTLNTPSVPPNANGVGHHMTTTTTPNGGPYSADVSQNGCGVTSDCTSVITVIPRGGQPCQLTVVDNTVMSVCAVGSNGYHSNNNSNSFVTSPPATTATAAAASDKRKSTVPVLPDDKSQDGLICCVINGDRASRLMDDMASPAVTATIPPIVPSNNNCNIIDTVFHHQLQQQPLHPCNMPSLSAEDCYYSASDNRHPTTFPDAVSTTATMTNVADSLNVLNHSVESVHDSTQPSNNKVDATCCQSVCNNIVVADGGSGVESRDSCTTYSAVPSSVKDGSFYLNVVDVEERRLNERSSNVNRLLSDCSDEIPDEAQGKICAAVGKANLLTSKKFRQFRDLCRKNLNGSTDDVLVPTVSDLTGFWEMVLIQVADVDKMFAEIDRLSSSNWVSTLDCVDGAEPCVQLTATATANTTAYKSAGSKPRIPRNGQVSTQSPSKSVKADSTSDASRAREAARQRLVAAKMAGRRRKTNDPENDVEIFVS